MSVISEQIYAFYPKQQKKTRGKTLNCIFFNTFASQIKNDLNKMELTGKIIAVLPERGGTSPRTGSEWKAGSYVLETLDQYPRKMCFDVFGADRIQQFNIQLGEILTVSFDIEAREYQGRWFNSIRAFRVDRNVSAAPVAATPAPSVEPFSAAAPQQAAPTPSAPPADLTAGAPFAASEGDDLPF